MSALLAPIHRVRLPLLHVTIAVMLAVAASAPFELDGVAADVRRSVVWVALAIAAVTILVTLIGRMLVTEPPVREVRPPVLGRWMALNSPATKVPSHGIRSYGQAYAIDLLQPPDATSAGEERDDEFQPGDAFRSFGQPVLAMIDGEVVRASGWRRDHRSRPGVLGLLYFTIEGMVRSMGGPSWVTGNHVTIRGEDGTHAVVCHLQRGSLRVRRGDQVQAGEVLGLCGNSGNSTEPHVHGHLMDRASLWTANGIPLSFDRGETGDPRPDEKIDGWTPPAPKHTDRFPRVPADGQIIDVADTP
jgi:murein DD-endopeptidase MepM/ murein hydrolase activator NlpD